MQKNTLIRGFLTIFFLHIFSLSSSAYDFFSSNSQGIPIYYNKISSSEVEVTYEKRFIPTPSYKDEVNIPSYVSHDDQEYTVTRIGERAFFDCRNLKKVMLPAEVVQIGKWAFAWCDALTSISLPSSLVSIGADAFDGCYALDRISVSGGVFSSIDGVVFADGNKRLEIFPPAYEGSYHVPADVAEISDRAFGGSAFLTSVVLPQNIETIGNHAFYYCNWLKVIDIPASVKTIGSGAFADCASLAEIGVSQANANYASHQGLLYDKDLTTLIQCPGAASEDADIPATVNTIAPQAFFRNLGMPALALPDGISTIGECAFLDCPYMTAITLPSTVNKIGSMALAMCTSLEAVYADMSEPAGVELGEDIFTETNLDKCTLYVPQGAASKYRNAPQWSAFKNIYETDGLMPQTISWAEQSDSIDRSSSAIQLVAAASSGLPVRYLVSPQSEGYGYISGDSLIITAPGKISVTAYQIGNRSFLPAPPVAHSFNFGQSGIQSPEMDAVKIYGTIGKIIIKGAPESAPIRVFSISGVLIYNGYETEIAVGDPGIYIVAVGGRSYKVAVR